eukprot:TRINITY_DN15958_c0_g1_i1.p1 TRINITY_DN15958_c0_g1~~TRINITY_DN15958_c0_g1_i1.p1  ORF type:complete len:431 (-),score=47.35 TRINITY_DN15958_c0_g1_i1:21-1313(-)
MWRWLKLGIAIAVFVLVAGGYLLLGGTLVPEVDTTAPPVIRADTIPSGPAQCTCPAGWNCRVISTDQFLCERTAASPAKNHTVGQGAAPPLSAREREPFCAQFVTQVVTRKRLNFSSKCQSLRNHYQSCSFVGAGHFGAGLLCTESAAPLVIKVRWADGDHNALRLAAKEAVVGCQIGLLKRHGIAETFAPISEFHWCTAKASTAFLATLAKGNSNESALVSRARSSATFMAMRRVNVPDISRPAEDFHRFVDAGLLWELFYSVVVINAVLDYAVLDLRLHHMGWTNVSYHRHYHTPTGHHVLLPPGRTLQLIDFGSYYTRHRNFTSAGSLLSAAFFFTMFKRDRIRQLDPTAEVLFRWCSTALHAVPTLQSIDLFAAHLMEAAPHLKLHGLPPEGTRTYRLPPAEECRAIAGEYSAGAIDFDWRSVRIG